MNKFSIYILCLLVPVLLLTRPMLWSFRRLIPIAYSSSRSKNSTPSIGLVKLNISASTGSQDQFDTGPTSLKQQLAILRHPIEANDDGLHAKNKTIAAGGPFWNQGVSNGTIYVCGYDLGRLRESLFPEFPNVQRLTVNTQSTARSLLLFGLSGPCPGEEGASIINHEWVASKWNGKSVFVNGESSWGSVSLNGTSSVGIGTTSETQNSVHSMYVGLILAAVYESDAWLRLLDQSRKPRSRKERFCVYLHRNCVAYREAAADRLAAIGLVFHMGGCQGANGALLQKVEEAEQAWPRNYEEFSKYRFCLVMENKKEKNYVTEKILNAFLGGCIPIYYGTLEVFDIFNRNAFIYYDISNPGPALDKISALEKNRSAYLEIAHNEPILANGADTIEQYFSFSDHIGNGTLKRRLREKLGMNT